jgi:hypothetical protein
MKTYENSEANKHKEEGLILHKDLPYLNSCAEKLEKKKRKS